MIGAEKLPYVNKAKVLGVWLQCDLKWDSQVENMIKKANQRLFMLRSVNKFGFDHEELVTIYKSYVRPIIEYGDVVWHSGLSQQQAYDLERIQKRACRTILGFNNYTSYLKALDTCGLNSLHERRDKHCLKFASGLADNERTKHLMPPLRSAIHGRNLRNSNHLSQLPFKTKRFQQSPIPYFVSLVNQNIK